jgi:hypothetical protein
VRSGVEGFETFFEDNYGAVLRSVAFALGDRDRAEDLTQEAFARAYQRWGRVAAMERPVTWVYVVALNAERTSTSFATSSPFSPERPCLPRSRFAPRSADVSAADARGQSRG